MSMDEKEWNECQDPQRMLDFLRTTNRASERKLRLFTCACCRRLWHLASEARSRRAIAIAERYADGLASKEEVGTVADLASEGWPDDIWTAAWHTAGEMPQAAEH